MALMCPESNDTEWVSSIVIWLSEHDVLGDLGEVSKVELVMELTSSWHELSICGNSKEHRHGCIHDLFTETSNTLLKCAEVIV